MLDPLVQLGADWRQAVAITIPAEASEVAPLLDQALDELERHHQLDEHGLDMAIEVICGSLRDERPETMMILRERLKQSSRDYHAQVGLEDFDDTDLPEAFNSAVELADALSMMVLNMAIENDTSVDQVLLPDMRTVQHHDLLDHAHLRKSLVREQRRHDKTWQHRFKRVFGIVRAVAIVLLGAIVIYLLLHPSLLSRQVTLPPTPVTSATPTPNAIP